MSALQDEFEAKFPMPAHCVRCGESGYVATSFNAWDANEYRVKFDGFKAGRETVSATPADLTCKCRQLGDWKGFHHPLCDASRATPEDHSGRDAVIEECALIAEKHADGTGYADDCTAAIRALKSAPSNGAWVKTGTIGGVSATMAVFPTPVLMRLPLPADGDSAETRTAFREYDAREPVADRTPWQVWRDALAYAATRNAPSREPVKPRAPRGPALQVDDNGDLS